MRNALLASFCLIAALGCGFINDLANKNGSNSNNGEKPTASPTASPSPNATETKPTPAASTLIPLLKKSAGKYPYEIKLMENAELKERLTKLLGKDYAAM